MYKCYISPISPLIFTTLVKICCQARFLIISHFRFYKFQRKVLYIVLQSFNKWVIFRMGHFGPTERSIALLTNILSLLVILCLAVCSICLGIHRCKHKPPSGSLEHKFHHFHKDLLDTGPRGNPSHCGQRLLF